MPNWCFNELYVTGDVTELSDFVEKFTKPEPSFNNLIPMPEELDIDVMSLTLYNLVTDKAPTFDEVCKSLDTILRAKLTGIYDKWLRNIKKYGYPDWYYWRLDNWGVKWDLEARHYEVDVDSFYMEFNTAWNPPDQFFINVSKQYPNLRFEIYYETEGLYRGYLIIKNGEIIDEYEEEH